MVDLTAGSSCGCDGISRRSAKRKATYEVRYPEIGRVIARDIVVISDDSKKSRIRIGGVQGTITEEPASRRILRPKHGNGAAGRDSDWTLAARRTGRPLNSLRPLRASG